MAQIKLSVVFILAATAIADAVASPFPMFHGEDDTDSGSFLAAAAIGYIPTPSPNPEAKAKSPPPPEAKAKSPPPPEVKINSPPPPEAKANSPPPPKAKGRSQTPAGPPRRKAKGKSRAPPSQEAMGKSPPPPKKKKARKSRILNRNTKPDSFRNWCRLKWYRESSEKGADALDTRFIELDLPQNKREEDELYAEYTEFVKKNAGASAAASQPVASGSGSHAS